MFYYFGYGSNMSIASLRAKGVDPVRSEPAVLHGWVLCFNLPNFFPIEGGVGNIMQRQQQQPTDAAAAGVVYGVLHLCRDCDLATLDELEAVGVAYKRTTLTVTTLLDGRKVEQAYVYVALPELLDDSCRPSQRYMNILIAGAKQMKLPPTYIAQLEAIETVDRPLLPPFRPNNVELLKNFTLTELAAHPTFTSIASYVFDMTEAGPRHEFLLKFFGGRDVTLFMLKRMDSSRGYETLADIIYKEEKLSSEQQTYLNEYLHEFAREYRLVGRIQIKRSDLIVTGGLDGETSPASRASRPGQSHSSVGATPPPREQKTQIAVRRVVEDAHRTNQALQHENLGFLSFEHGFMPALHPDQKLPASHRAWDDAAASLPSAYRDLTLRRTLESLSVISAGTDILPDKHLLRAALVLGILSHAYWYVETSPPPKGLPLALAVPWKEVRSRLGRNPEALSYIDLIVYNFRLVDPTIDNPLHLSNLRLLVPTVDNNEERVFYLTQAEILHKTTPIVLAVVQAQEAVSDDDPAALEKELLAIIWTLKRVIRESLVHINPCPASDTFVDPVVWAKTVAPFAVPMKKGVQGPSGTSSPIFNTLDIFFGRKSYDTFLGREIKSLRDVYPPHWREFLAALHEISVPDYIAKSDSPSLKGLFKDAVETYAGSNGFLGRHRMKVYGYLEMAFKVGRSVTIGGFAGMFKDRTWDEVDSQLQRSRHERLARFSRLCHHARIKYVGPTHGGCPEGVRRVVLDVSDTGIRYETGDRCGILPENREEIVRLTLAALGATGDEVIVLTPEWQSSVSLRKGHENATELSLYDVLRYGRIRPVTMRVAEALHAISQEDVLHDRMITQTTDDWELWELLNVLRTRGFQPERLWRASVEAPEHICAIVPPERFRMYSISSAMADPQGPCPASEIHLTVGRVQYLSRSSRDGAQSNRQCLGSASSFLTQDHVRPTPLSIIIEHPSHFSLPYDPATPIILMAGGTGCSPFRGFIQERIRQAGAGSTWIYLSYRSREHFYYSDELRPMLRTGRLQIRVCFSREEGYLSWDNDRDDYTFHAGTRARIQDLISGHESVELLREQLLSRDERGKGGMLYVCGHARFARSVTSALRGIFARCGTGDDKKRDADAQRSVEKLVAEGRYCLEVFTDARSHTDDLQVYDLSDISLRNSETHGFWMVIENRVYDLTNFMRLHPGGSQVLQGYAGRDATQGYRRAHSGMTEIDAMLQMYEIGRVRHLNFGDERIEGKDGPRHVPLTVSYRAWLKVLYLVVEMQNALSHDQSLQGKRTTRADPSSGRTLYKLQRAVETHERFIHCYLLEIGGDLLMTLSRATRDLQVNANESTDTITAEIKAWRDSDATSWVISLSRSLNQALYETKNNNVASKSGFERLQKACEDLERRDALLLHRLKALTASGVRVFELYEKDAAVLGSLRFKACLGEMISLLVHYTDDVKSHFHLSGWTATTDSELRDSGGPLMPRHHAEKHSVRLVDTSYWSMKEIKDDGFVFITRKRKQLGFLDELVRQNQMIMDEIKDYHREFGVVVDMRQAPMRNDPEFENAMRGFRLTLGASFARLAVLIESAAGVLQVNRISRTDKDNVFATQSESSAIQFAMGTG